MTSFAKPSPADIDHAIRLAELGGWIDPSDEVHADCWECLLYAPDGNRVGDGRAHTPNEAMALAWLHVCAPDALSDAYVEPGSVPHDIPEGWRFELAHRTPLTPGDAA